MRVNEEMMNQKLETLGRLEVMVKAEVGSLRDQVAQLARQVEESSKRADKLVDKLIEMAMVNSGAFREAVGKARSSTSDPAIGGDQNPDPWASEDEWPPKGHVAMNMP
jgi:hypothetical protein